MITTEMEKEIRELHSADPENNPSYEEYGVDAYEEGLQTLGGDGLATCMVCRAPLTEEGACTREIAQGREGWTHDHDTLADFFGPEHERGWRSRYHSQEEARNAPPISFLIEGFLQREGVTAIAGPVRERKSLIALNIVHALVTGEKLFGHFAVMRKPKRVLYLCPEVSLGPFTDRVKAIGLMDYVGRTFFYRTLSAEGRLKLSDLKDELPGSVVFLDTAIRFFDGDENSSAAARAFADGIFALMRGGAGSVVMLHHSPKSQGDGMTLESAMRGSGDLGAFLACCWGTKLQDPTDPYKSASFLSNLKQRDFESADFEVSCGPDCRMTMIGDPATRFVKLKSRNGQGNKDGQDAAAEEAIRANMEMPIRQLAEHLESLGIKRGTTWVSKTRARLKFAKGGTE